MKRRGHNLPSKTPLRTGWQKDPYDKRDRIRPYKIAGLPEKVILDRLLPPIRNQGNVGSCVGHGIGANLYAQAMIDQASPGEWFSPTWIYNGARFLEGTLNKDVGCFPRSALEWLTDKGAVLEHLWPYDPNNLDKRTPPSSLEPEAAKWPVFAYSRVIGGAQGICAALAEGKPVSIGTPWYDKWMATDRDGALSPITERDSPAGGHETCAVGYDASDAMLQKKGEIMILCMNSWGPEWGDHGYFWMPASAFSIFTKHGGYDAHTIDVHWESAPLPDPNPPDPSPDPSPKRLSIMTIVKAIVILAGAVALATFIYSIVR